MVELSIEVMEGLRDPLIGLRCWISRCTCTTFQLAVAQRLHEFMRGIYEFSYMLLCDIGRGRVEPFNVAKKIL